MKKIKLSMDYGRVIHGELKEETEKFYQVVISKVDHPEDFKRFKKADWQKGDLIKVSKELVKEVSYD